MNNLQHIVKDNTRFAMHIAVELCDQGDFDSVPEAFRWLNQEAVGNYTRWHELFGTPERAASTLKNGTPLCGWCDKQTCEENGGECSLFYYDALLEWLGGDA